MKNANLVFIFAFSIPLVILAVGLYQEDWDIVGNGFSLMAMIFASFVGNCVRKVRKVDAGKHLKSFLCLFLFAMAVLLLCAWWGEVVWGGIAAMALGLAGLALLLRRDAKQG